MAREGKEQSEKGERCEFYITLALDSFSMRLKIDFKYEGGLVL